MNSDQPAAESRTETRRKSPGAQLLLAAGMIAVLSSCGGLLPGLGKLEDATVAFYPVRNGDLSSGFDAFQTLIVPLLNQSKCTGCHATQSPTITAIDVDTAYTQAKTRLNLVTPSSSVLISKSQNLVHCGNCPSAPVSEWTAAVEQWATAESATGATGPTGSTGPTGPTDPIDTGTPPVFVTAVQQLTGASATNRTISLAARGAAFAGINLQFDVQDPYPAVTNTARVYNLRLQNTTGSYILVRGIRLFQSVDATINPADPNDFKADLGAVFTDVDVVVNPNTTLKLSIAEALLPKAASDGLYYAFGFQALEVTNAPGCKALGTFNINVNSILGAKCTTCHGSGGPGTGAWAFSSDPATRCAQALQRSDLTTPTASKLIQFPFYRQGSHPSTGMTQADVDAVVNWITLER